MAMKYSVVLWDFDGTLVDTLDLALSILHELADRYGFRSISDPQAIRGMTLHQFLREHHIPAWRVPFLYGKVLAQMRGKLDQVRFHPGVKETVTGLADRGIRQAIVSSNNQDNIIACLTQHDMQDRFELVVGYSRLFGKHKAIRKTAHAMQVPVDQVIYVGDETRDIAAARKAGVDVAAVTWGLNSATLLRDHCPTYAIEVPQQLLNICLPA
jgi:phosphoglycolate phosphatase